MADFGTALQTPRPAPVAGMAADIARDEQKIVGREAALADTQAKTAAARDATLAPMEGQITAELGKPVPERPKSQIPTFKPEPVIDAKEYEQLSYGLIAFAMIGGVASKGKWLEVGSALNGAMTGYLQGNQEVAAKRYKDYETGFKGALAKEQQANREFEDVLKNRQLKIQDMISQYKVIAAKYDRQDARAAAESRSIDGMWKALESRKTAMAKLEQQHYDNAAKMEQALMIESGRREDRRAAREDRRADQQARADEQRLSPETLRLSAQQYLAGDKSVFTNVGRGTQGGANLRALRDEIAILAKERGMTGEQITTAIAEFEGLKAGERALGTRTASFGMAGREAENMAELVLDASKRFGRTNFAPVNKALAAYQTNTGGTEVREFGAALNSFINAYARAISPSGVGTVHDKEHAREMLSTADSQKQVEAIIGQLRKEMKAAGEAPGQVLQDFRNRRSTDKPAGGAKAPAAMSNDELLKALGG